MADKVHAVIQDIRELLKQKQDAFLDKQDLEVKNKPILTYKIGDSVLLRMRNITPPSEYANQWKLRVRYGGPFEVTAVHYSDVRRELPEEQRIPTAYTLKLPTTWKAHPTFTPDNLKRFKTSESFPSRYTPAPPQGEIVAGEQELYVDDVLRTRWFAKGKGPMTQQWLIKWRGYPIEEATWETFEDINTEKPNEYWDLGTFRRGLTKRREKLGRTSS